MSRALARHCPAECATRGAILDAVERRVITWPTVEGGWLVRKEGEELVLYVIAGRGLSTVRGVCAHHTPGVEHDDRVAATVDVSRVPFRDEAEIKCRIERSERKLAGQIHAERVMHWTFDPVDMNLGIAIEPDSLDGLKRADAEQAESFVHAVASALVKPQPPSRNR